MSDYIFFSKSNWNEAPRLRHQVANLIRNFGGKVKFFQKPYFFWQQSPIKNIVSVEDNLTLVRTKQLLHHQLRVFPFLGWLNAIFEKRSIAKCFSEEDLKNSIVINFNYDYFFLREIFPGNKIVTIINDDFIAQSKFFAGAHAAKSLSKTCAQSDAVLVVSYPLMRQVSGWCVPDLFFPWADIEYKRPVLNRKKDAVLLWAHIDGRIDFDLMRSVALLRPNVIFYIVGPVASNAKVEISKIDRLKNVLIVSSASLEELPMERFFAAIIPYRNNVGDIEAVTMSNKSLQLMSRGLPIVTHGMPSFYEHSAIVKSNNSHDFVVGLDYTEKNFPELQSSIENLVSNNQSKNRFEFLNNLICNIPKGSQSVQR